MTDADAQSEMDPGLIRYWFEFEYEMGSPVRSHAQLAHCGVTAFDLADAKRLIEDEYFKDVGLPTIRVLIENVDVSTITFPHRVIGGITYAPPIWRGIWFPVQTI